jgi:hypothetical protein
MRFGISGRRLATVGLLGMLVIGCVAGFASAGSEAATAALPPELMGNPGQIKVMKENPDGSLQEVWVVGIERKDAPAGPEDPCAVETSQASPPVSVTRPSAGTKTLEPAGGDLSTRAALTAFIARQHEEISAWAAEAPNEQATALVTFTGPWSESQVLALVKTYDLQVLMYYWKADKGFQGSFAIETGQDLRSVEQQLGGEGKVLGYTAVYVIGKLGEFARVNQSEDGVALVDAGNVPAIRKAQSERDPVVIEPPHPIYERYQRLVIGKG